MSSSGSGLVQVQAFGVNHNPADALLWVEPDSEHRISIKLAVPAVREDLSRAKAVCYQFVPSFETLPDAPFQRQADGRYVAVIKGRDVAASCGIFGTTVETCVAAEPRGPDCIQGTAADGYEQRRSAGIARYHAVVTPMNGEARLYFDPAVLARGTGLGAIDFAEDGIGRQLTAIWRSVVARDIRDRAATRSPLSADEAAGALTAARDAKDAIVRQALWANYLSLATARVGGATTERSAPDRSNIATALRELTPPSPFWALVRTRLPDAVQTAGMASTVEGYAGEVVRHLAIASERPLVINSIADAAHRRNDPVTRNAWIAWLLRDYQGHYLASAAGERYGLSNKIQPGRPFPEFTAASLDDPSVTLTAKTIGASYLLVDFWATWCEPCIKEIPSMQKAYDRFSARGFRILSYSLDENPELVKQFRRTRLPMPWLHALVPGRWDDMTDTFGLFGIPAPVLLDANGRVVAMRADLMGGKLEALLETLIR